ncbi:Formin-like protein [Frankliniella fusca]|uniref:Formin-like protein n=1 Tax=Frankliniella fusca TaxID=407009 RepID=A0AAE1LHB9_9NEOP|nr:Formin-like protein [Frankliniella fusca]
MRHGAAGASRDVRCSDSRVGFGYRFGPFADFQVLLELGPQSETQPIGGQTTPSSKRQVVPDALDEDPGRRPDIQLLDVPAPAKDAAVEEVLDVPDPAPPSSNSRSARSGPAGVVPGANRVGRAPSPAPPPPAASDWLSRWRSGLGLAVPPPPPPPAARVYDPAPRAAPTRTASSRTVRQNAGTGYGYQPQRRAPSAESRWDAMRRLRSLYWAGQQG